MNTRALPKRPTLLLLVFAATVSVAGCAGDAGDDTAQFDEDHVDTTNQDLLAGRRLTNLELATLAHGAGIHCGWHLVTAVAIANAESQRYDHASNRNRDGTLDRGLWQINSIHGAASTFDERGNARAMVRLSSGGHDWSPWVSFNAGRHKAYIAGAVRANNRICT